MEGVPEPDIFEGSIGGGEDLGGIDALGVVQALTKVAARTAVRHAPRRFGALGREWARIALGRSDVAPQPKDWRFANRAWSDNPLFRRIGQSYLAWAQTMLALVEDADLDWRTAERARFAANLLTSALAPTNQFLLNPDALERALETGGQSAVRGIRNLTRDVLTNKGFPQSVPPGRFQVGKNLAVSPGAVVHRSEVCELIQFAPSTGTVHDRPVVIVPPQINKYYVMDLAPGRSFVEFAVAQGFQVFSVSWRNPSSSDGAWGLDTYVAELERAAGVAAEISGADAVSTVSVCAGGLTTAALLGHLAAQRDELVHAATFAVTHLDYRVPSSIGMLGTPRLVRRSAEASSRRGVLDGRGLYALFALLRPNDLVWNFWVNNNLLGDEPSAFDVMAWNADSTSLPAALHGDFLDIFLNNTLARGELDVLGSRVDIGKVECDALVVGARTDHLVPWKACYATTQLLGGRCDFLLSSSGHIQCLVSPPGKPKMTVATGPEPGTDADEWLAHSREAPGVWWEHWARWQAPRAGGRRASPTVLGSPSHPAGDPAPGLYVLNG